MSLAKKIFRLISCNADANVLSLRVILFLVGFIFIFPAIGQSTLDSLLNNIRETSGNPIITSLSEDAFTNKAQNPEEAIRFSLEAVELSKKEDYADGLIFNFRLLGNLYFQVHNYEQAIFSYDQCIQYALPRNDTVTIRECYLNKGAVFFTKGLNSKALDNYLLGLDYSRNLDKEKEYNNIGAVFFSEGEFEEAYNYYNKALDLLKLKNDQYGISVAYNNIGDVFRMMGKYDIALSYYNKVLARGDTLEIPDLSVLCLNNIGLIHGLQNNKDSAIICFQKSLDKAREIKDPFLISKSLFLLGQAYFEKGLFAKAKPYLEQSYNLSKNAGIYTEMSGASYLLQLIFEKEGSFKQAYHYANMHKLASDSLFSNEAKQQVLKLMFDHKIELQELERQNFFETEKHERKRSAFKFYSVIFALIIIVLIGAFILFRSMQRVKINRIEKEKAELKIMNTQIDLEMKNREIVEKVLKITEKNELLDTTFKLLHEFSGSLSPKQKAELDNITREIQSKEVKNQWDEFYYYFTQVYSKFYEKLESDFPNLTLSEKRLCAFLKLNMTTKDIAAITYQNFKSIEVARTRLRRKLNMTNSSLSFQEFFSQYN
ncbi:MAG: tetratricopeptide repeat protein [Bacteroidales bacterium]|nr:tetratricopeptide repeat protein [Bacteroidales bacterium]